MNTRRFITLIAALAVALPRPAAAQKKNDLLQELADVLDAFGGGGKADPPPKKGVFPALPTPEQAATAAEKYRGNYAIRGGGTLAVSPLGQGVRAVWKYEDGATRAGVGLDVGGMLVCGFGTGKGVCGLMAYDINGGTLRGRGAGTTDSGAVGLYVETLTGPEELAGKYTISRGIGPDGKAYAGECTIRKEGDHYRLKWEGLEGVGFLTGRRLLVGWSASAGYGVVAYAAAQGGWNGIRLVQGGKTRTREDLTRLAADRTQVDPGNPPIARAGGKPRTDRFGNVIPDGPPPAGLERPIDAPVPAAPAIRGGVVAPGQTAADLAVKQSRDEGGGEVTLTVTNAAGVSMRVNWLDQDGKEGNSEDVIPAGETVEMGSTGAGHFFRARDARTRALLQEFRVKNNGGKFHITITGGTAAPAPVAAGRKPAAAAAANPDQAIAAFLDVHNDARAAVGVPPLQWSGKLATHAQEWANEMARSGKFEHRPNGRYGENLAGYNPPDGPDAGARMWLAEKKDYRGEKMDGRNYQKVGHYTQMVWRKSTHVGFGTARMPNGMWVVVANYEPAGNMQGEHPYK